jgi:hypothetical protein
MQILGYDAGPIRCRAAFTSDFAVPADMPIQQLVNNVENERASMDVRRGMRHKYVPLRFDPATGAHLVGGRYLFDSWDDLVDYVRFTSSELEFEPGVKFWDRPFFLGIDKHAWYVVGAHDFTPMASTHYVNRLERFTYTGADIRGRLAAVWPTVSEAAATQRLASAWLLFQPDEHEIGIVTVADRVKDSDDADTASRSLAALEHSKSLARFLPRELAPERVFDRTSLNLSLWLPRSRDAGGAPSAFPTFPLHPIPDAAASSSQDSLPTAPAVVRERPGGERMRAIVLEKFGGLDSLVYTDIPKPLPKHGEVVIQVRGFGLNHAELHMRRGEWAEAAEVSGIECVGVVDSCPEASFRSEPRWPPLWVASDEPSTAAMPNTPACARRTSPPSTPNCHGHSWRRCRKLSRPPGHVFSATSISPPDKPSSYAARLRRSARPPSRWRLPPVRAS